MANTISFINEQIIYFYMEQRFQNGELYLFPIIKSGKLIDTNNRKEKIIHYKQYSGTRFPDIDEIKFLGAKENRPGEVKFVTSKFNYHNEKKYINEYNKFKNNNGVIIVVKHDCLPNKLDLGSGIDVYQIDYIDFIQYCKENFSLLIARQLDLHLNKNIWIMYASKNFFEEENFILPAIKTKRWAPSQNLSNLEIGIGDIIIFIQCKGENRIQSQKYFLSHKRKPHPNVYINTMFITEVKTNILSREEYCYKKKINKNTALWPDEIQTPMKWDNIFEFNIIKEIKNNISLKELYDYSSKTQRIATFICEVYQMPNLGRKISEEDYLKLLEFMI
jgi:hypothetical protein